MSDCIKTTQPTQPIPADAPAFVREMQRKIDEALKGRDRAEVVKNIQQRIAGGADV